MYSVDINPGTKCVLSTSTHVKQDEFNMSSYLLQNSIETQSPSCLTVEFAIQRSDWLYFFRDTEPLTIFSLCNTNTTVTLRKSVTERTNKINL